MPILHTWVGDDQQQSLWGIADQLRHNALENLHIALDQRETGLALALAAAGGDHADLGAGRHRIV